MSEVLLFLDMDGVLADLNAALEARLGKEGTFDKPENKGTFNLSEVYGLPPEKIWSGLGVDFWAGLPPTAELPIIKAIVRSEVGWQNTAILSSPLERNSGECVDGKIAWLGRHFPELPRRQHFFGSKKYLLAHPGAVLLDDWEENTEPFIERGGEAVLLPRPWNSRHGEVNSFDLQAELSAAVARARRGSCRRKPSGALE